MNDEHLRELLGTQFVAYSPVLARAVKGVKNGLYLTQLMYWGNERAGDLTTDGWFTFKVASCVKQTGMTGREQETARKALLKLQVIDAERRGTPYQWWYRINWTAVVGVLEHQTEIQIQQKRESRLTQDADSTEARVLDSTEARVLDSTNPRIIKDYSKTTSTKITEHIGDESDSPLNGKEKNAIRKLMQEEFESLTALKPPPRKSAQNELWWTPLREICDLSEWIPNVGNWLMFESVNRLEKQEMTISSPKSIIKTARAIKAERDRGAFKRGDEPKGFAGVRSWLAQGG